MREISKVVMVVAVNPTGSRPSDLNGLCRQHAKPHPPTHKERQAGQGNPNRRKGAVGKGGRANKFTTDSTGTLLGGAAQAT